MVGKCHCDGREDARSPPLGALIASDATWVDIVSGTWIILHTYQVHDRPTVFHNNNTMVCSIEFELTLRSTA